MIGSGLWAYTLSQYIDWDEFRIGYPDLETFEWNPDNDEYDEDWEEDWNWEENEKNQKVGQYDNEDDIDWNEIDGIEEEYREYDDEYRDEYEIWEEDEDCYD